MGGWLLLLLTLAAIAAVLLLARRAGQQQQERDRRRADLGPVRKLVFEDVTVLGAELQQLDQDLAGRRLDEDAHADHLRALDAYERARTALDALAAPQDVRLVT
jgi:hypothetical protein